VHVLFDAERLRNPNSGLGQLCRGLGAALVRHRPAGAALTFLVREADVGTFGDQVDYDRVSWTRQWVARGDYDVWHATHQDAAWQPNRRARVLLSIMDLNFLERADYSAAKKTRRLAAVQRRVDRASAVTTISEYSASVIRARLRLRDRPLHVIYPAETASAASIDAPDAAVAARLSDGAPFLLFVGGIHPRKNVHTLLPMLARLPGYRLVLAGPADGRYADGILRDIEALQLGSRVTLLGAVDEATKSWLYEHCAGLVFPSLSEGFGLPVVEAMARGAPVFLSRLTSLPEVGGADAFYFENFDPDHMASVVRGGLEIVAKAPARTARMRARAAGFSWDAAAAVYWRLYADLATQPARHP